MTANIIGVCGKAGVGKDTVSAYLVNKYGYTKIAFADPIKRFLHAVFGFHTKDWWGPSELRNEVREVDWDNSEARLISLGRAWLSELSPYKKTAEIENQFNHLIDWFSLARATYEDTGVSLRVLLQTLGTGYGRAILGDHIWIDHLLMCADAILRPGHSYTSVNGLSSFPTPAGVVVSDIRFLNEIKAIKEHGGKIIQVSRTDIDSVGLENHQSETEQEKFTKEHFDFLVNNDGSKEELFSAVDVYLGSLK